MSRAIASARQRRAGITQTDPTISQPSQNQPSSQSGLTLPQVIALVDSRLITLEKFMKDSQSSGSNVRFANSAIESRDSIIVSNESGDDSGEITDLNEILNEYNSRFMLLAEEISEIKDTLMKLQTYTMSVNKMLLEERVNVLSDLGNTNSMFIMNNTTLNDGDIDKFEVEPPVIE